MIDGRILRSIDKMFMKHWVIKDLIMSVLVETIHYYEKSEKGEKCRASVFGGMSFRG